MSNFDLLIYLFVFHPIDPTSVIKGKYANSKDEKVDVSKKIIKRKRLLDHSDKGLIIKIYRENKEKDPKRCMIKTIKQALGVQNVNTKDYNNYRNQIYHWIKKESKIAKKKNMLSIKK